MANKSKNGNKKHGRHKLFCTAYRLSHRHEFNKARRLIKYLRKHAADKVARKALEALRPVLSAAQTKMLFGTA